MFKTFWAAQRGAPFTALQVSPLNLAFVILSLLQLEKNRCLDFMIENRFFSSIMTEVVDDPLSPPLFFFFSYI